MRVAEQFAHSMSFCILHLMKFCSVFLVVCRRAARVYRGNINRINKACAMGVNSICVRMCCKRSFYSLCIYIKAPYIDACVARRRGRRNIIKFTLTY